MTMKRIAVLTSGGDAPGMNAALYAIVNAGEKKGIEVFAVYDGYKGLVEGNMQKVDSTFVRGIVNKGGTKIGSARLPEFAQKEVREKAIEQLNKNQIDGLIVIGGDGTYHGGQLLSQMGVKVIGLPGTIDNDIASTDKTIGFSTTLSVITDALDRLRDTSESHARCSVLEVMGRYCGDLAVAGAISGAADYVVTAKTGLDTNDICKVLNEKKAKGQRSALVVVSEHVTDVHALAKEIEAGTGYETRATILGYIQRGGVPTAEDRILATRTANYAVELMNKGVHGCTIGEQNGHIVAVDFKDCFTPRENPLDELYKVLENTR